MSWYKRYPAWLHSEWQELYSNGNYKPAFTFFDGTFLSCGCIVVRSNTVEYQPVLIVYPESTPYQPPSVYLLTEVLPEELVSRLATMSQGDIEQLIRPYVKFLYRRHQGPNGSLCFLEMEDLHREEAEFYGIRQILKRVRDWLAGIKTGRIPADSPEVELFSHFPHQQSKATLLIPDEFLDASFTKGRCYFSQISPSAFNEINRVYLGVAFESATTSGIVLPLKDSDEADLFFIHQIPSKEDILQRSPQFISGLEEGTILEGSWWSIDKELEPFATIEELASYLGTGQEGFKALLEGELATKIRRDEDLLIGIRFPARSSKEYSWEWQFFRIIPKGQRIGLVKATDAELMERLAQRSIEAIRCEYVDEQSFFKRNKGVFSRDKLKESKVSLFGMGAIGSELADCLAKAGVGHLHLVDMDMLKAQNTVRHLCGSQSLYWPKPQAVAFRILQNAHHFVQVSPFIANVFHKSPEELFPHSSSIGVSTIANDNTEGFLNEMAVRAKRTMFYARALRGGKAARIFRVIPGIDACKNCLSLYFQGEDSTFVRVEDDLTLPVITTECNNPIRPASAADLKLIASLTTKIVLEYLEKGDSGANHWIWSTEELPGLSSSSETPYRMKKQFLDPHPECPVCSQKVPVPILLSDQAKATILDEVSKVTGIETGGILIGFETQSKEIVILEASGPGPKAIMTATHFERDIEYCQKKLEEASAKFGVRGLYVGEWHFHPIGRNEPSPLDINSLHQIAEQKNYATDQPVMIIADSQCQLSGTVHFVSAEILPTNIAVIPHNEATMKEALLSPA